jgi:tetratricopeptide (TPR) repeat protein
MTALHDSSIRTSVFESLLHRLAGCLVAAVLVARLVTPTEGASIGETIWIAQAALLALCVWGFAAFRSGTVALPFGWIDRGVLLLVGGHVLSALVVLAGSGDKRAALTMLWEWLGVGATFFVVRQGVQSPQFRHDLLRVVLAVSLPLAVVGLHQYFFGYDEIRSEYAEVKSRWDDLQRRLPYIDRYSAQQEEASLRRDFARLNAPVQEGARILWEQRINLSREPFGMFALANTFAGLLGVALVLWIGRVIRCVRKREGRRYTLFAEAACVVIGFCLYITKSRTAYVGLMAALAVWMLAARSRSGGMRRKLTWLAGAGTMLGLILVVGWYTGLLDPFLLLHAGKSLQYRAEYWEGTWNMLCAAPQHLLLGVGPGNFRQHYLQFKLPGSSEEIADPHNLFFDAWANGGLPGLAGLILVLLAGLQGLFRTGVSPAPEAPGIDAAGTGLGNPAKIQRNPRAERKIDGTPGRAVLSWAPAGACLAFLSAFVVSGWLDDRLLFLLAGYLGTFFCLRAGRHDDEFLPNPALAAAFVFLGVHLLGAGGIGMPAISQILLLLPVLRGADPAHPVPVVSLNSRASRFAAGLLPLALYAACWITGTSPAMNRMALLNAGEAALFDRYPQRAEADFRRAAEADRLSPEPYELLATLYHAEWLSAPDAAPRRFDLAVDALQHSIARNPDSYTGYRMLGEIYLERHARTRSLDDAARGADYYLAAVARYPQHAELQAQTALAMSHAGRTAAARSAAEKALELDRLNRQLMHIDKYVSEKTVAELKKLLEGEG